MSGELYVLLAESTDGVVALLEPEGNIILSGPRASAETVTAVESLIGSPLPEGEALVQGISAALLIEASATLEFIQSRPAEDLLWEEVACLNGLAARRLTPALQQAARLMAGLAS